MPPLVSVSPLTTRSPSMIDLPGQLVLDAHEVGERPLQAAHDRRRGTPRRGSPARRLREPDGRRRRAYHRVDQDIKERVDLRIEDAAAAADSRFGLPPRIDERQEQLGLPATSQALAQRPTVQHGVSLPMETESSCLTSSMVLMYAALRDRRRRAPRWVSALLFTGGSIRCYAL
jgi:hypothetical protein